MVIEERITGNLAILRLTIAIAELANWRDSCDAQMTIENSSPSQYHDTIARYQP
jgi:hypothetical protein